MLPASVWTNSFGKKRHRIAYAPVSTTSEACIANRNIAHFALVIPKQLCFHRFLTSFWGFELQLRWTGGPHCSTVHLSMSWFTRPAAQKTMVLDHNKYMNHIKRKAKKTKTISDQDQLGWQSSFSLASRWTSLQLTAHDYYSLVQKRSRFFLLRVLCTRRPQRRLHSSH